MGTYNPLRFVCDLSVNVAHLCEVCIKILTVLSKNLNYKIDTVICQAAKLGVSLKGATLYCRMTPCRVCAMLIINCGIERVVYERKYHAGEESEAMFRAVGLQLEYNHDEVLAYEGQGGGK